MLGHATGMIGLPLQAAGARDLRPRRQGAGATRRRAGHRRREDRAAVAALLGVHGRGDAARPQGRVPRRRRDPALRRPRARPRLHPPPAARARHVGDDAARRGDRGAADPPPGARVRHPVARPLLATDLCRLEEAHPPAAAQRHRRLLRRGRLRHRRADPPPSRRRGGGDGVAVAPHPQRPGRAVPVGRGRLPRRHRRDRHGPQHGRRSRRLRRAAQVRRPPHALAAPPGNRPDRRARRPLPPRRHIWRDGRRAGDGRRNRRRGRGPFLRAVDRGRMAQRAARLFLARGADALARRAAAASPASSSPTKARTRRRCANSPATNSSPAAAATAPISPACGTSARRPTSARLRRRSTRG